MKLRHYLLLCLTMLTLASCREKATPDETAWEKYYINIFAGSMMSTYYLWADEIENALKKWQTDADPVEKVKEVRYSADKWTQMLPSYSEMIGSMSSEGVSYGYEFEFYLLQANSNAVCAVVTLCYPDTPAAEAGIKRGDVITKINGKSITTENYQDLYYSDFMGGTSCTLTMYDGTMAKLQSRNVYENPVLECKVFDCDYKKVGYMVYTSFTLESCSNLIDACKYFKEEGVKELILDLRYNSGGYVMTENLLASMLAPAEQVENAELYMIDVYNDLLTENWGKSETYFATEFSAVSGGKTYKFSTSGCNIGLEKLYVLTTNSSASASESLITGLRAFMPVDIIGDRTSGKYCAGVVMSAEEWYEDTREPLEKEDIDVDDALNYCGDWGIYVMISRYADRYGSTPGMPDGFTPDISVTDTPEDGIALGDPSEALLHAALAIAGYNAPAKTKTSRAGRSLQRCDVQPESQGYRLYLPGELGSL